jgi:hypothetical protein
MNEQNPGNILFVTGVRVAVDEEHKILIAGVLSESPFTEGQQEAPSSSRQMYNFAFTRQHAAFLRDHLDDFLKEEK